MTIIKNCILLLKAEKSQDSDDKYEVMLSKEGFIVKHIKTLDFEFSNLDNLKQKLSNSHLYSGIIFTTPRAIKAIEKIMDNTIVDWQNKLNYVVGETTHNLALQKLNLNCKGQESGNADKVAITKPLLFPCGNLKSDDLLIKLHYNNLDVEPIVVYSTVTNPNLNDEFSRVTHNFKSIPEYFVYFSPSGVNSTIECIKQIENQGDCVKFIALGPSTEAALKMKNIKVNAVASKPTPQDLVQVILS